MSVNNPFLSENNQGLATNQIGRLDITQCLRCTKKKLRGIIAFSRLKKDQLIFGVRMRTSMDQKSSLRSPDRIQTVISHKKTIVEPQLGCLFHPDSKFKNIWNLIVFLLLCYIFTGMPYILAFKDVEFGSSTFYFEMTIDFLFLIDILITLNSAYIDSRDAMVTSRYTIFMNYFRGMLVIDILAIIPFSLISENADTGRSNSLIRIIRISKLSRVIRVSKILSFSKNINSSEKMSKCLKFIKTYRGVTRLASTILVILLMAHFTACMWYYFSKIDGFNPDTWIVRYGYQDSDEGTLYMSCLYFSFTILTTVGFGDISAYTESEMIICIIWMLFGIGTYSFIIGTLTSVLSHIDSSKVQVKKKLHLIEDFHKEFDISKETASSMKDVVNNGESIGSDEDKDLLNLISIMPKNMRYKIAMAMNNGAAKQIQFFKRKDPVFICAVVPKLTYIRVKAGDILYSSGDHAEEIYFIVNGKVNFILGDHKTVFKSLVGGCYFGEIELLNKIGRKHTAVAQVKTELLVLKSEDFDGIIKSYPEVAQEIEERAEEMNTKNEERVSQVNSIINGNPKNTTLFTALLAKHIKGGKSVSEKLAYIEEVLRKKIQT